MPYAIFWLFEAKRQTFLAKWQTFLAKHKSARQNWAFCNYGVVSTPVLCPQLLQQCLRLLEVGGVKPFGEPPVDWCQEVTGFLTFALLLP